MKNLKLALGTLTLSTLMLHSAAQADSLVEVVYQSAGDANGNGQCTLIIKSVDESHKYGDEVFELESSGDGACEWSAMGISKSYAITAETPGLAPEEVKIEVKGDDEQVDNMSSDEDTIAATGGNY